MTQCAIAVPRQDLRVRVGAEHQDLGVALQKQAQLGHRNLPGAGDDDAPARETEKDREMLHGDCLLPVSHEIGKVYAFSSILTVGRQNKDKICNIWENIEACSNS